jgi:type IV pilus assembly protein PilZ
MSQVTLAGKTPTAGAAAAAAADAKPGAPRASVMALAIKEKAALYASYMPFIKGGGLFVPTTRGGNPGDSVYLMLQLMDDPTRMPLTGKIVWVTPQGATGKQQGLGIQFPSDPAGELAKGKIEALIGGALQAARPTHTI